MAEDSNARINEKEISEKTRDESLILYAGTKG